MDNCGGSLVSNHKILFVFVLGLSDMIHAFRLSFYCDRHGLYSINCWGIAESVRQYWCLHFLVILWFVKRSVAVLLRFTMVEFYICERVFSLLKLSIFWRMIRVYIVAHLVNFDWTCKTNRFSAIWLWLLVTTLVLSKSFFFRGDQMKLLLNVFSDY